MQENGNPTKVPKSSIRPAIMVDARSLREYADSLHHLLVGLTAESHQAALICPPDMDISSIISPTVEVIHHPYFNLPILYRQNRRALTDALTKFRPTTLHCFGTAKVGLTRHIAHNLQVPYILTINSIACKFLRSYVSNRNCAAMVASSANIAESVAVAYPNFADRIKQINIGTFISPKCACFSDSSRVTSLVTAGRLDDIDDYVPLLNALRHLAIDGFEFFMAIIGTGRAQRGIYRTIKKLGLAQNVTLVGDIQPLRSIFNESDIYIQPIRTMQFNSHLLEAMSAGMAVAAAGPGIEDMVIEDKTAVFFDPDDELSLYSTLRKLLTKKEFAKKLATQTQQHLREKNSVSKMIEKLVETYTDAQQWHKNLQTTSEQKPSKDV